MCHSTLGLRIRKKKKNILPVSGVRKFTCWIRGTNPSTFDWKRARAHQMLKNCEDPRPHAGVPQYIGVPHRVTYTYQMGGREQAKTALASLPLKPAFRVSGFELRVWGFVFRASCFVFRVSGVRPPRNVKRFRGGLSFKAHRLLYHPTLGLSVKRREEEDLPLEPRGGLLLLPKPKTRRVSGALCNTKQAASGLLTSHLSHGADCCLTESVKMSNDPRGWSASVPLSRTAACHTIQGLHVSVMKRKLMMMMMMMEGRCRTTRAGGARPCPARASPPAVWEGSRVQEGRGSLTLVSPCLRLKDIVGPVTRVKKKRDHRRPYVGASHARSWSP